MSGLRFDLPADVDLEGHDEAVRIFLGKEGGNAFLIRPEAIGEPFMFGMMCVDLLKHGAMAFAQASGADHQETFKAIVAGFTAEMQRPTDASPN